MIVRRWWEPRPSVSWERVARTVAVVCAGVAFLIAMVIVYGTLGDKNDQIGQQGHQIDRQGQQIQAQSTQIEQLTAQVDANNEVSSCRSKLTVDINDKLATHQQAIGALVAMLGVPNADLDTAQHAIGTAALELGRSITARKAYELDTSLPCPITAQELNP